jgi:formate hydrogenlyase subunit 4
MNRSILYSLASWLISIILAPSLFGVINRIKAWFAGRRGQPILQSYHDLYKLFRKGVVYSRTTSWLIYSSGLISLSGLLLACMLMPLLHTSAVFSFSGDLVLFAYLLGLARFFIILGALDSGSSFEGMGASREAFFSTLAEPALFLVLATLVRDTGSLSLTGLFTLKAAGPVALTPEASLLSLSLFLVLLVENSRIPFDDPSTHLELTMIHEVMVLDHSGPDFAFILSAAAVKIWLFSAFLAQVLLPATAVSSWMDPVLRIVMIYVIAVLIGVVESVMARVRLLQTPQLLIGATILALLGFIIAR